MFAWLKELDGRERKTLIAAVGGWATDSVDVMVFTYVVPTLMAVWGMSKIEAGWITTATVISSAIGGCFSSPPGAPQANAASRLARARLGKSTPARRPAAVAGGVG